MAPTQHDRRGNHSISTLEDIREYVRKIKSKAPDLYTKFGDILKDFRSSKINMHEVKYKVTNLFRGHDDLLQGFHMCIKDDLTTIRRGNHSISTLEDIREYVRKIRSKAPDLCTKFGDILKDFRSSKINMHEVKYKVANLFRDHDDLVQGFHKCIKDEHTTIRLNAAEYVEKVRSKAFYGQTPDLLTTFRDILMDFATSKISMHEVKYKMANLFHGHDDLLQGFYMLLEDEHPTIKPVLPPVHSPL